jgi:hypothetical protein
MSSSKFVVHEKSSIAESQRGKMASAWAEEKRQAVKVPARAASPSVDAREAFGFAPMSLKGAAYRWRGV